MTLQAHPATAAPMVRSLDAQAWFTADADLAVAFRLRGDIVRLRIPEPRTPAPADGLWETTCFELFVGVAGEAAYREFNFSPSGEWAAYAFTAYRQRDPSTALFEHLAPPTIVSECSAGRLELTALIAGAALPSGGPLQIGLAAVVEAADVLDGRHSYWALRHPAARPDFHHRDGFVLGACRP
ncbi:MAG TPA: DOMON-like domain-containing protein [Accumulibacter sp.]|nr:DOMON-like domain-containing protein [Accumulibacter sp.]HMW17521.1 DOMON-like domain-containing protein [Accumulibacter sp.]HMY05884.1 DOMON-like domain-containing protein [Accumulibacter sp.]HND80179.1 DOMON-like domain-containing protein [Accumulibacter sp.]HNG39452.1 DOMON-like domain-containing protein [Accumulibacter sp.]